MNCSSLIEIAIPLSVTSIGNKTFMNCSSLRKISLPSLIPANLLDIDDQAEINYIQINK